MSEISELGLNFSITFEFFYLCCLLCDVNNISTINLIFAIVNPVMILFPSPHNLLSEVYEEYHQVSLFNRLLNMCPYILDVAYEKNCHIFIVSPWIPCNLSKILPKHYLAFSTLLCAVFSIECLNNTNSLAISKNSFWKLFLHDVSLRNLPTAVCLKNVLIHVNILKFL